MDAASLTTLVIRVDMTPPGPNANAPVHFTTDNTLRPMTTINKPFEATIKQLWILIHQLEELNTQLALFLRALPTQKPSMANPCKPSDNCLSSNKPIALYQNQATIVKTCVIPPLPLPAFPHLTSTIYPCIPMASSSDNFNQKFTNAPNPDQNS